MPGAVDPQGLLLATDSVPYHKAALALAAEIGRTGWSAWEMTPNDNFMVGFLAALYAIFVPKAWIAIPFSALAHAVAVVLLVRAARFFTDDSRWALVAALPYALFPSAAFWYTQLLKDGYFNVGILAYLVGWMMLVAPGSRGDSQGRRILVSVILIGLGYALQGLVRPYTMTIVLAVSLGLFGIVALAVWFRLRRGDISPRRGAVLLLVAFVCVVGQMNLRIELGNRFSTLAMVNMSARGVYAESLYWQESPWVPAWLEIRLASLSGVRTRYILGRPDAMSTIDKKVTFVRAADVIAYIPRAIQIAFLAPFPNQWFGQGSSHVTTIMRRESMVETLLVYGLLLGLPIALFLWYRRAVFWIAVVYPGAVMTVYALATPNIGTLYRVRYGYLMVFLALSIVAVREMVSRRRQTGSPDVLRE